jgi:CelD/BcsL family acetyltransferase involved in cellulose biosynthesis
VYFSTAHFPAQAADRARSSRRANATTIRAFMTVDIIDTAAALEALSPQWDALWRRCPGATPFQSPHWLLPWWKRFGSDAPYVIAASSDTGLEALAPVYILRDDDSGESLGMLMGTGISDYLDILGAALPILGAITAADCQMWDFQQLRPSSELLTAPLPEGWSENVEDQDPCPVLSIADAGDELEGLLSTHARKKLRYYRRALERIGRVTYESATSDSLDELLTALFDLHAARWQKRNLPGVLADDIIQEFHRDAARRMLAAGALRMYAIRIDERIVAVFYGFAHAGTVCYYLSGYDPSLEKLSIGNVLVAHAIESAVRDGATTFDFLRGAEEYKYSWGATDRINRHRQMFKG